MATQELANEAFGQTYGLFDRDSVLRYVGKNKSTLENRMNLNNWKVRMDPTSSPLYRYVQQNGGSFDGWTIRPIARITYDHSLLPDALVDAEDECITALRRAGHPLLNKNKAKATRARRGRGGWTRFLSAVRLRRGLCGRVENAARGASGGRCGGRNFRRCVRGGRA